MKDMIRVLPSGTIGQLDLQGLAKAIFERSFCACRGFANRDSFRILENAREYRRLAGFTKRAGLYISWVDLLLPFPPYALFEIISWFAG
jgi:hypothetical protein